MNLYKKIFLLFSIGGYFLIPSQTSALLWEDLGLDLYKKVDEGFYELQEKQYEYEMTGQWETSINEVINPILADRWVECDITSTSEIERILDSESENQVQYALSKCGFDGNMAAIDGAREIISAVSQVKDSFTQRAQEKSKTTYDIARIWLYNDGIIENSPFDLVFDLQEIDRVIFSEELEYEWVPYEWDADDVLDDFLEEDKSYLYEEDEDEEETEEEIEEETIEEEDIEWIEEIIEDEIVTHNYVCLPGEDTNGLDDDVVSDIIDDIENPGWYTPYISTWEYPGGIATNGASWWGPFPGGIPSGSYSDITDEWGCNPDSFFCIVIEFEKSNYGLAGWETVTIEKILATAAGHLEKPANASITQHKMATNNFEISSVIKNLPDMLRWFGLQVQTKPIPVLELEDNSPTTVFWPKSESEIRFIKYYKNIWLDYERRNDLMNYAKITGGQSEETAKVIQTAAGMPTTYIENRLSQLADFQEALSENNRVLSMSTDKWILFDDMDKFAKQFSELERFVAAIEDFSISFTWHVQRISKIPIKSWS